MPRRKFKPDPEVERAIGNRLREFRERMRETQSDFALALFPTTRQQLANIESGRTPLRYRFARLIAVLGGVAELDKLAGLPSATKAWPPCPDRAAGIGKHTLLSEVAAAPAIERPAAEKKQLARLALAREWAGISPATLGDMAGCAPGAITGVESGCLLPDDQYIASVGAALNVSRLWLETGQGPVWDSGPFPQGAQPEMPTDEDLEQLKCEAATRRMRVDYYLALAEQMEAEIRLIEEARSLLWTNSPASPVPSTAPEKSAFTCENPLTLQAPSLTSGGVKSELPKLIARLRAATSERGRKSLLAAALGVHRQCVTDWLSGKQMPNGETTLRLLAWVTAEEAKQQQSPASGDTPAEPKAQVRKPYAKKPNSDPP